jgi:small subunit ribosomal protein S17
MPRKSKIGMVVSNKMQKSIVVEVTRTKQHPLYKKYIRVRKKYMAHDEQNVAQIGDQVRIEECRPLSKSKSWELAQVMRHAHGEALDIKDPEALAQAARQHGHHAPGSAPAPTPPRAAPAPKPVKVSAPAAVAPVAAALPDAAEEPVEVTEIAEPAAPDAPDASAEPDAPVGPEVDQ